MWCKTVRSMHVYFTFEKKVGKSIKDKNISSDAAIIKCKLTVICVELLFESLGGGGAMCLATFVIIQCIDSS